MAENKTKPTDASVADYIASRANGLLMSFFHVRALARRRQSAAKAEPLKFVRRGDE